MRKQGLPALTGIRFYAAALVYLSHVTILPGMEQFSGTQRIFDSGVVGVSFFFVLSGFILTYNYGEVFRTAVNITSYWEFVWARLTKIYPVQVATLLFMIPVQMWSPQLPLDWRAVPIHLALLQCFWPSTTPPFYHFLNVPSWSISCEWFFYLLAPLAMYCVFSSRRRWALIGICMIYFLALAGILGHDSSDYTRLYFVSWFAPSRFPEFLIGVFLGWLYMTSDAKRWRLRSRWLQLAGVALLVGGAAFRSMAPWPLWGGLGYLPGSALLVFGLAHGQGWLCTHLSGQALERLGTASFALYLVHAPILRVTRTVCLFMGWAVHSRIGFIGVILAMFVVVQAAAALVCYFYEIPMQRYLRNFAKFARAQRKGVLVAPRLSVQ